MPYPPERKRPALQSGASRPASSPRLPTASVSRSEEDEARASSRYRAALEALFAPKKPAPSEPPPPDRSSVKMVTVPPARESDPRQAERDKRVGKLLAAEGRAAVSRATDELMHAGFALPVEQDVLLKVLDHGDEDRVRAALGSLLHVLDGEPPKRRAVLEARVRRLEDDAEEAETRALASALHKKLLAAGSARLVR